MLRGFKDGQGEVQQLLGDDHFLDVLASHREKRLPDGLVGGLDSAHRLRSRPSRDCAARVVALPEQLQASHRRRVQLVVPVNVGGGA